MISDNSYIVVGWKITIELISIILKVQIEAGLWSQNRLKSQEVEIGDKYRYLLKLMFNSKLLEHNLGT